MSDKDFRIMQAVGANWVGLLRPFFDSPECYSVMERLKGVNFIPEKGRIYRAFHETRPEFTKVVLLGQDPYPHNHANGLSFSTDVIDPKPASLINIFKEISMEYNMATMDAVKGMDGDLSRWAVQGVLLLNTVLTTEWKKPGAHIGIGWEKLTSMACINLLKTTKRDKIVFILLGKKAEAFMDTFVKPYLNPSEERKLVELKTSHPSPYSANSGFLGSEIFRKCNNVLGENEAIDWVGSLDDVLPF